MIPARILVADDDPDLLRSITDALERSGSIVVGAEDGADLLQRMANDGPFSIVVTDVAMPWMTGLQVMHAARYAGNATPIVVMTALRSPWVPAQVHALGHDVALLQKPFELGELEDIIDRMLSDAREHAPIALAHGHVDAGALSARAGGSLANRTGR